MASELTATPTASMSGQPGTLGPREAASHPHAAAWVSPGETTEGQPDCHPGDHEDKTVTV